MYNQFSVALLCCCDFRPLHLIT